MHIYTPHECSLLQSLILCLCVSASGLPADPAVEGLSRERARERDRGRPQERRHHSAAGEKQRYYSCERYGGREHYHTKSAGPSRSTSPGETHDLGFFKQVSGPRALVLGGEMLVLLWGEMI